MDIQRTIPVILDENPLVAAAVLEFNRYQRMISPVCFNDGDPLRALELHQRVYRQIPTSLGSQMKCSAIRATAAAYAAGKRARRSYVKPVLFRRPSALFLSGKDFSFRSDGSLSVASLQGRQKIGWRVPARFSTDFKAATSINSLRIAGTKAWFCITLTVPEPSGIIPVGIDLGVNNALVASTTQKTLFVSGKTLAVQNTKTRKVRRRLQIKLSEKKAQHTDTRSVRRVLKRLSRKTHNRNQTFCRQTAAQLCHWSPENTVLVFEDLRITPRSRRTHMRRGTRRRMNSWFFSMMTAAVQQRAERQGIALAFVDPAYTSQLCSQCGLPGIRKGHRFTCACGYSEHADVNAAQNVRLRFTALRRSGDLSASPEALTSV